MKIFIKGITLSVIMISVLATSLYAQEKTDKEVKIFFLSLAVTMA